MYIYILTRSFQAKLHCIKSKDGDAIAEPAKIDERWWEYCEELYENKQESDVSPFKSVMNSREKEPPLLRSEVVQAVYQTSTRKSPGPDNIPAELFKEGGDIVIDKLHEICLQVWETG